MNVEYSRFVVEGKKLKNWESPNQTNSKQAIK
jgi:hypothetical protein